MRRVVDAVDDNRGQAGRAVEIDARVGRRPLSITWKVKVLVPLKSALGVNTSAPPLKVVPPGVVRLITSAWADGAAAQERVPWAALGRVVIFTALNRFCGPVPSGAVSSGSVKPKPLGASVCEPSSLIVFANAVPTGRVVDAGHVEGRRGSGRLIGVWPPPEMPPLSWTWKVNVATAEPNLWSGTNFRASTWMSETWIVVPFCTGRLLRSS